MDKKHTIGNVTAGLMIVLAALFDGVQFLLNFTVLLLPLSLFLTFCATILFGLWFALAGVKYDQAAGRKLLIMIGTVVAELAPIINTIPAISAGVIGMVVQTRLEDIRANAGGKITPKTAQVVARKRRMDQMRQKREAAAREERESREGARLSATNDNGPQAANDNSAEQGRIAA